MKFSFFVVLILWNSLALTQELSMAPAAKKPLLAPFPSTVEGITIRNTHLFSQEKGFALRGMVPLTADDVEQLTNYGVNEILIFRSDNPGETGISDELSLLTANPKIRAVHLIPFRWKNIPDFKTACEHTINGLQLLRKSITTTNAGLFFHCTVGEDRTGYLAAIYRILYEKKDPAFAFTEDMCAHGYAEGDPSPGKQGEVVRLVHENITLSYLKMLNLIEKGSLKGDSLDLRVCDIDPGNDIAFRDQLASRLSAHRCQPQPAPLLDF